MITVPLSFDDIAQCYYIVRKQALLHRPWFAKHFSSVPGLEQHQHPPGGHGRCALTWMHRGPSESSSVWAETGAPVSPTPWPIREEVKDKAFHWANGSWIIVKRLVHHIINFFLWFSLALRMSRKVPKKQQRQKHQRILCVLLHVGRN